MSNNPAAAVALREAIPINLRRSLALSFPFRWTDRRTYRLPASDGPLGAYYIGWRSDTSAWGEDWSVSPFDSNGVLLTLRGNAYHPIRIAQFALQAHAKWIQMRAERSLRAFIAQADWLRDNQQRCGAVDGCYAFGFPWLRYGARAGWISAMAQGEAISVLLRADEMVPRAGYLEAAMRAAMPFRSDVKNGGVVSRTSMGDLFFEEVAVEKPPHILNGHIFALWGLWELHRLTQEEWLRTLVTEAVKTLCRRLPLYDSGYWSYYNLLSYDGFRPVATLKYHAFHIAQLRVLAAMCNERSFGGVADRWEAYQKDHVSRLRTLANTLGALGRRAAHRDRIENACNVLA
ncbi:MAG: hypothetical protein JO233_03555 [Candidatus Eremiobacteraeota bacterium]|nr:hypothetical protein [Candidatus Eremiobacteraeota bacterium]